MRSMKLTAVATAVLILMSVLAGQAGAETGVYLKDDRGLDDLIGRTARLEIKDMGDVSSFVLVIANPALCGGRYEGQASVADGVAVFTDIYGDCSITVRFSDDSNHVDVQEDPSPCMTPDCPLAGRYYLEGYGPPRSEEEVVGSIREHYSYINNNLEYFETVRMDVEGRSTEGGELEAWIADGDFVKKIVVTLYGELGQDVSEYYYFDNRLLFCFQTIKRYDRPLGEVAGLDENRYYFDGSTMVRWLDPDKVPVPSGDMAFGERAETVLQAAAEYRDMVFARMGIQ